MGRVVTVLGDVEASELGPTLMHEHIFIDLTKQVIVAGMLNDPGLMVAELSEFWRLGGRTVVDCTTRTIGRDPDALVTTSKTTGLNIVMGCGWYREPFIERAAIDEHSVDELTEELVREIEVGVGASGIKPGIIGEIGSEKYITAHEERALRAAGRAQVKTGLSITTHTARWPNGLHQLAILQSEGVDPRRVIVGHVDSVPNEEYHADLLRTGCFVQLDTIRAGVDYEVDRRVGHVVNLLRRGGADQVLLSHDVWSPNHLRAFGGGGFSFLMTEFADRLMAAGVSKDEFEQMTVVNPAHALSAA